MSTTPEATSYHSLRKFSIHLPLRAIQNLSFHYETPCNMCIINMKNVEPIMFGDAFLNFVRFETFAQTPFFDFGHFQRIFTAGRDHFTNNIVNSINSAFGLSRTIFNSKSQGVFRHLHQSHGFIDILFFNCIDGPETGKCCSQPRIF